ncbi:EexN family lipoprotein [Escherichia coli]|nr:EexN family lipoprotein [Escherichia coli]
MSIFILSACGEDTKSSDWWLNHPKEATEKYKECKKSGEDSVNCQNVKNFSFLLFLPSFPLLSLLPSSSSSSSPPPFFPLFSPFFFLFPFSSLLFSSPLLSSPPPSPSLLSFSFLSSPFLSSLFSPLFFLSPLFLSPPSPLPLSLLFSLPLSPSFPLRTQC